MGLDQKKIHILTTGQPSTNPRLVKEANALAEAGFKVKVYYQFWTDWALETDKELLKNVPWEYELVGGTPYKHRLIFLLNKIKFKLLQYLANHTNLYLEHYKYRAYSNIAKRLRKERADHYIAHNLGALPLAAKSAKYHRASYSFDAEDYHRGQYQQACREQEIDIYLENRYIPNAKFVTSASPLINEKYVTLYPQQKFVTINNVFPNSEFRHQISINNDKPLKLVWFSQTIGKKRGLEEFISALNLIRDFSLEINLIGNCDKTNKVFFEDLLIEKKHSILFHKPIFSRELNIKLSDFDIGLATETGRDLNNDIALSNKVFSYIQAGLAILASTTSAQQHLLEKYSSIGSLIDLNKPEEIAEKLKILHNQREKLHKAKSASIEVAKTLNWDVEKHTLLSLFKNP